MSQGYSRNYILKQMELAQRVVPDLLRAKAGPLWILDNIKGHSPIILQELALSADRNEIIQIFEVRSRKMSFSGRPDIVDWLLTIDFLPFGYAPGYGNYGGGDPSTSKFWGFKPSRAGESISTSVRTFVVNGIVARLTQPKRPGNSCN
jgi:hypothetical protein